MLVAGGLYSGRLAWETPCDDERLTKARRAAARASGGRNHEVSKRCEGSQRSVPKEKALRTAAMVSAGDVVAVLQSVKQGEMGNGHGEEKL